MRPLLVRSRAFYAAMAGRLSPFAIIGIGAVILFPAFYAIVGFIITLVGAWLYNITASLVGGIEVDLGSLRQGGHRQLRVGKLAAQLGRRPRDRHRSSRRLGILE